MTTRFFAAVAALWVIGNAAVVYLVLGGERTYRIESACFLFAAVLLVLAVRDLVSRRKLVQDAPPADSPSLTALVPALGVAAWCAVMWVAIDYPFLSDDYVFLGRYSEWRALGVTAPGGFFRPVFALVFWLFAPHAGVLHALGALLHLGSTDLVRRLTQRVFSPRVAWLAALLFLLNPLQLEAVLWVSGLQELLWTCFALAALWVYSRQETLTVSTSLASLMLTSIALGSKETAVCAPALFIGLDWVLYRFRRGRLLPIMYLSLVLLVLSYLGVRSLFVELDRGYFVEPTSFFVRQFVANPYKLFAQPWSTAVGRVPGIVPFVCTATTIFFVYGTAIRRRAWLGVLIAVTVVLASTLPVYSDFYVGARLEAARYLYFASIGWSIFVATSLDAVVETRRAFAAAAAALLCMSATCLGLNLGPWKTAGSVVRSMEAARERGDDPAAHARRWASETGAPIQFEEGIPREVHGVNIFLNGYPEFLRLAARERK